MREWTLSLSVCLGIDTCCARSVNGPWLLRGWYLENEQCVHHFAYCSILSLASVTTHSEREQEWLYITYCEFNVAPGSTRLSFVASYSTRVRCRCGTSLQQCCVAVQIPA
jgi:hypothetical protein